MVHELIDAVVQESIGANSLCVIKSHVTFDHADQLNERTPRHLGHLSLTYSLNLRAESVNHCQIRSDHGLDLSCVIGYLKEELSRFIGSSLKCKKVNELVR